VFHLLLFALGLVLIVTGFWQFRRPEKTQAIAAKAARYSWQRRIFGSENYLVLSAINGLVLMVIGIAVLVFVAANFLSGTPQ
jgi:hypothetical protein